MHDPYRRFNEQVTLKKVEFIRNGAQHADC